MYFKGNDVYGNCNYATPQKIRHILDLLDGYMQGKQYEICEMWQDNVNDKNKRIDIKIQFINENEKLIIQKLLIMNDEVIDGEAFHKRYNEWYGKENLKW